jgi:type I restriction enzyme S subunit
VVFAKIGEALKSNRFRSLTVPTIIDNNMMGAEPSPGTDATFLYYLLVTANLPAIAEGSALPYLRAGDVARLPVVVPTLPEQQAIAEVLGALDDKIDANRNVAVRAEALAIRLPELVEETTSLGAVAHSDQKTVATSYFAGKEVEHFSLPAFDAGRLPIVESGDEIKSGKCLLEGPTVLVSKLNPHIPRVWMATLGGALPAVTSTEFLGLTPATDYPTEVLWALCASDGFRSQLLEMVKGTTGSHQRVSREDILALQIPDPEAMDRGAWETIAALVCLADGLRREAARLASLRDTLLPRLLSGEQRLRVAQDLVQEAV